jgi:hypothetical protein
MAAVYGVARRRIMSDNPLLMVVISHRNHGSRVFGK